jgi:hypothetical protein
MSVEHRHAGGDLNPIGTDNVDKRTETIDGARIRKKLP